MITDRPIEAGDEELLAASLAKDAYHTTTKPEFFVAPNTTTKVYEDESGAILFARCSMALRIDIQFVDNGDKKRNLHAMLGGFAALVNTAKQSGFNEVLFNTDNPELKKFCIRAFGFEESGNELRKVI
jgi:hypothetical protein